MKFGKKSATLSKKYFNSKLVYNDKYLKTKLKFYDGKSKQIFTIIRYPKNALNECVYQ